MKAHSTIVQMMAAITDPVVIERCYQIFAAKRALLASAEETRKFQHCVMEPKPVQKRYTEQGEASPGYKLLPSFAEASRYMGKNGKFVLRLHGVPAPVTSEGFRNGQLFALRNAGYERSSVKLLSYLSGIPSHRNAIIHNKHLESVFRFQCGCINDCCCSARN